MATNPNGIFSAALATGPRVEPFDVGQWLDQHTLAQAQASNLNQDAALRSQQARQAAIENQKAQIQLQLEQQRRETAKNYSSTVPSTPPPATFPKPSVTGYDDEGNPTYEQNPNWQGAATAASNPVPHFDWDGYSVKLMALGDPEGALTAAKTGQEIRGKDAQNAKAELENLRAKNSQAGEMLGGLLQSAQPKWADGDFSVDAEGLAKANAQYQAMRPQLRQLGLADHDTFDPSWAAPLHSTLIGRDQAIAQHNQILSGQETAAGTKLKGAQAGQAEAQTKLINEQVAELTTSREAMDSYLKDPSVEFGPKGRIAQLGLDKDSTTALTAQIADIIHGPGTAPEKVKAITAAKQKAVDDQLSFNKEKRLIPLREAAAVGAAKARATADNPELANVAPAVAAKAVTDATKLDNDYNKARQATEAMGHFLDLTEKGNKAAGSNLPLVGVETLNAINGIKRINSAEINQYEGAGSLLDRIQGRIGKLATGQPIPQDVLEDIRELHQTLGNEAYDQYTSGLESLNKRTKAQFQPTLPAPNIRKAPPAVTTVTSKADHDKLPSGAVYIDSQDGKQYRKK